MKSKYAIYICNIFIIAIMFSILHAEVSETKHVDNASASVYSTNLYDLIEDLPDDESAIYRHIKIDSTYMLSKLTKRSSAKSQLKLTADLLELGYNNTIYLYAKRIMSVGESPDLYSKTLVLNYIHGLDGKKKYHS